ncbi:MAG TPA: oligopeptide/dipeptide ABC transporter ATP-binding protein [Stellaceae bacterium]|jgi:peptide/nickel transport system ATP-binding protein/oligopeptide transport system ATP-binding protein
MTAPAALAATEDLAIHFASAHGRGKVMAVDGVTFSVWRGETFGIIGESGSGKSTLGRALVGLQKPTRGKVLHEGHDLFALRRRDFARHRRDFPIVFQDATSAMDPRMTIVQSVREPLDIAATMPTAARAARVAELLDAVGLSQAQGARYPRELSGGQNQRATIARTLALSPKLIVCDEVVAPLDVSIQADILNLFAQLQQLLGLTYVFITHDLGVVAHISDRIAVMYLGKFVELAPAAALMTAPLHPYTQALLSAEPDLAATTAERRQRIVLKGEIPSAIDPPSGCSFRTRCWRATEECALTEPPLRQVADGRFVACHYAEEPSPRNEGGVPGNHIGENSHLGHMASASLY